MKATDRIGQTFGRWTIVGVAGYIGNTLHFTCRCACGRRADIPNGNLYRGLTTQCMGCAARERGRAMQEATKAKRARALARRAARAVAWNGSVPIVACFGCGAPLGVSAMHRNPTLRCRKCNDGKYGPKLRTIAEYAGVSRQAVSDYIRRHGPEAALKFYGLAS